MSERRSVEERRGSGLCLGAAKRGRRKAQRAARGNAVVPGMPPGASDGMRDQGAHAQMLHTRKVTGRCCASTRASRKPRTSDPTIEKTLQHFERTFKRRPHVPREVFTASECPVCLQLQRPTMLFPCNHGVCEGCFRDLGAIVAPLAGQLHVNSISFFHVRNFTLENMSQPHEVTWKES